ncbi:SRPBCC domain-containing protein [Paenibacillus sp. KN14-4R]|uniref:SRPBCC domain-containing protein n=1 Tax=Paenibacillus sp. KN14-4R TaxID=3445773 RepID=UPI003F9F8537
MSNPMITKVMGQELILERVFNAPRELVFKAFSDAEHLKHWWGPRGWTLSVCHVDFRPGGIWHYCMKCIDENQGDFFGYESWGKSVYQEIVDGEKIVYIDYFSDADGNEAEGMPSSLINLIFEEFEGKTKLINIAKYASAEALQSVIDMGMEQGVAQTWDRLAEHLQAMQ